MLRPATPLSILFFVAFVLLLLSTLSTPIIKAIPLATFKGVHFGVFGYCNGDTCSGMRVGYGTDGIFSKADDSDFSLPSATRHSLSSILIVHPIACLLTLICFALSVAAHFHSPAHSPRYLLALLILTFPTLLVSLLAFLVDILLFVPHMAWGGWIVLAATIIITASGVVTCAMRRTLVSRKARKKRIAENADMNGETYYNNHPVEAPVMDDLPKADSPPPLSTGDTLVGDRKGGFATFEMQNQQTSDDMTPLNPRNPSVKSSSTNGRQQGGSGYGDESPDQYRDPSRGPSGRRQPRDQYGNTIPPLPVDGYGPPPPGMQNGGSMRQGPIGPPMGPGGRGAPYGRGRGGPPRGGPPRGGYGRGGPQGMRGPPPPGWNGGGRGGMGPGMVAGMAGRGGRGPPPDYNNRFYAGREQSPAPYGAGGVSPVAPMQQPMGIGQAIEMDARNGTPPMNYGLRDSDGDVQGMLALQQGGGFNGPQAPRKGTPGDPMSPGSVYSDEYNPPRANWNEPPQNVSDQTLPSSSARGLSPIAASPVELPAQLAHSPIHRRNKSSDYYEDVDPRFADTPQATELPAALVPGYAANQHLPSIPQNAPYLPAASPNHLHPNEPVLERDSSYESIAEGSRSPAASEASHFTSVSQRGVNPNWRPPPPGMGGPPPPGQYPPYQGAGYAGGYGARRPPRQEDIILESNAVNPDFAIPGVGLGGRGGGRGGRGGGRQPGVIPPIAGAGGRYPGAEAI
ncbi:pali-domain-containing protein [Lophium mytilinum]|uniref:Pali-domain-containing protein n=1 Tax=Lophium mytilinum TaxID=390894 RepID=A0A6A6QA17_9PEZI|nr:pali-domain-containing protein [Lophium mytilinum]